VPYASKEEAATVEVQVPTPPLPWWLLALIAGVGGIALIGGLITYEEERKRRMLLLARR